MLNVSEIDCTSSGLIAVSSAACFVGSETLQWFERLTALSYVSVYAKCKTKLLGSKNFPFVDVQSKAKDDLGIYKMTTYYKMIACAKCNVLDVPLPAETSSRIQVSGVLGGCLQF